MRQSAARWLRGSTLAALVKTLKPPSRKAGVPVGTTISFTLDEAARVTLAFRHSAGGRRVAGTCVARSAGNATKPHGTSHLRFAGRTTRTARLGPGSYSVVVSATGPTGRKSAATTLHSTVKAP